MNQVLNDFQNSIRNGMGLFEALQKYNITLQYAMDHLDKPFNKTKNGGLVDKRYIHFNGKYFILQKGFNRRTYFFGSYDSFEDAAKVRDYFICNGWNLNQLDEVCDLLGVERHKRK